VKRSIPPEQDLRRSKREKGKGNRGVLTRTRKKKSESTQNGKDLRSLIIDSFSDESEEKDIFLHNATGQDNRSWTKTGKEEGIIQWGKPGCRGGKRNSKIPDQGIIGKKKEKEGERHNMEGDKKGLFKNDVGKTAACKERILKMYHVARTGKSINKGLIQSQGES